MVRKIWVLFLALLIVNVSCIEKELKRLPKQSYTIVKDSVYAKCEDTNSDLSMRTGKNGIFEIDDFPVPFEILRTSYSQKAIDSFFIGDQAWFTNDSITQILVIEVATDLHRMHLFNFSYNEFSPALYNEIVIHKSDKTTYDSKLIKSGELLEIIPFFIDSAKKSPLSYFKTIKGFSIGDCKAKALQVYGHPHFIYLFA